MNHSRETVFAALFAQLQTAAGFVTYSRRLQMWNKVDPSEQPAMFVLQGNQGADQGASFGETRWTLRASIFIYNRTDGQPATIPSTPLNALLDAVETALAPPPGMLQTLGGLAVNCWIDGQILIDEGVLDGQSVAVVPVTMLTGI